MSDWTIAVLPLLGVVLGAALHSWFGKVAQHERQIEELRAQAYADYLRAVAAAGHLRSDEDLRDAQRDAADAKSRIAVYGSDTVVSALARFEETGPALSNPESAAAFVSLVSTMRPKGNVVSGHDLELVLLGKRRERDAPRN